MTSTPNLYQFRLDPEQRQRLGEIASNGHAPAKKINHARVLLLSDHGRDDGHWSDPRIAQALGMHVNSVARIRKRFVVEGEVPALERRPRAEPPRPAKLDGHAQAHLAAICCSQAPEGHARWSLSLLADELRRRGLVTQVCRETVRQALKKTSCSPGESGAGASPNATGPGSSPRWRTSSTSTPPCTRPRSR
jgi:transposase